MYVYVSSAAVAANTLALATASCLAVILAALF
jgi:hypothetical protein